MISSTALNTQQMYLLSITKKLSFPAKLFFILEFIDLYAPHLKTAFCWKHHGRCIHISDKNSFEQNIMTLFFNSAKYDTFRRQLNIWGFTRIVKVRSLDVGCYFHEKFLRGHFDLCNTMTRTRVSEFMKMPGNQPDFENMPIMPATVTLSIPHFAGMAENLATALCGPKDEESNKKRKQLIEDATHDCKAGLYSSSFVDSTSVYSTPLDEGAPRLPILHSNNDTCNISNDTQHTMFSDQAVFPSKKKAKRVSVDSNSFFVNPSEDNDTFNTKSSTLSYNRNPMNLTMDAIPIEKKLFTLARMFPNQQQVDNFNSMNMMIPNAAVTSTRSPTTMTHTKQDTEPQWNENLTSNGNSLLDASSPVPIFKKKSSDILSDRLLSCNSLLSISAPADLSEMKDFLLDKSNYEWFEDSLSF